MTRRGRAAGLSWIAAACIAAGVIARSAPAAAAAAADDRPADAAEREASASRVAAWRAARAAAPLRLHEHASWCESEKLPGAQVVACSRIVCFAPDDAKARKVLRQIRQKDGTWKQVGNDTPPPVPPERIAEVDDRLARALDPVRAAAAAVWDDESAPLAEREAARADRIAADPDDAEIRSTNGEVLDEGRWLLEETVRFRERSADMKQAAAEAVAATSKPERVEPSGEEGHIAGRAVEGFVEAGIRVIGAEGTREAAASAAAAAAGCRLWEPATRTDARPVAGLRFFLFPNRAAGMAAVERDDAFAPADREFAQKLSAAWRPKRLDCLVWVDDAAHRPEWALRQSLQHRLRRDFRVDLSIGWAVEGIGHWFSEILLRSHRCVFVRPSGYAETAANADFAKKLADLRGSDSWALLSRTLARSSAWPGLRVVLGRDVNAMTADELVASYAFASFLVLGRPDDVGPVLRDAGSGVPAERWVATRFGATIEGLDVRLRRWLEETAARPAGRK